MIQIDGGMSFQSNCPLNDLPCGAKEACEFVTGETCIQQAWDCFIGAGGLSLYPMSGGPEAANFGTYAPGPGAGNICSCDGSFFDTYGIPRLYPPCTEGAWRFIQ